MRSALRPMVKYGKRQAAEVTLCISERLRLSSGHHAYGSAARPLRPQIKDGVVLEYIHLHRFHHFQCQGPRLQPLNEYSLFLTHRSTIHKSTLSWTIYRLV